MTKVKVLSWFYQDPEISGRNDALIIRRRKMKITKETVEYVAHLGEAGT